VGFDARVLRLCARASGRKYALEAVADAKPSPRTTKRDSEHTCLYVPGESIRLRQVWNRGDESPSTSDSRAMELRDRKQRALRGCEELVDRGAKTPLFHNSGVLVNSQRARDRPKFPESTPLTVLHVCTALRQERSTPEKRLQGSLALGRLRRASNIPPAICLSGSTSRSSWL